MLPVLSSLSDWLNFLEINHRENDIDLGLERINVVFRRLNLPSLAKQIVIIAGTNGKGSTITALEKLLISSGKNVASYTSPHIIKFNERIKYNGACIDDESFINAFSEIYKAQHSKEYVKLTYFEFVTLASFYIISKMKNLDVALLEIGLGGRLDAVNIIDPDLCIVTHIGLDHQSFLGETELEIASEKAGILKHNVPFICGDFPYHALFKDIEKNIASKGYYSGEHFSLKKIDGEYLWRDHTDNKTLSFNSGLLPENSLSCALQAFVLLDAPFVTQNVVEAVETANLLGRYQKYTTTCGRHVILDVAHNASSALLLKNRLLEESSTTKTVAVFTLLKDKDLVTIYEILNAHIDQWFLSPLANNDRTVSESEFEDFFTQYKEQSCYMISRSVSQAYDMAIKHTSPGDRIVVFGSCYLISELMLSQHDLNVI
jgi:dihydrofolate synthase / folylpolyglutamate synthase